MRRIVCLLLCCALLGVLIGCGAKEKQAEEITVTKPRMAPEPEI